MALTTLEDKDVLVARLHAAATVAAAHIHVYGSLARGFDECWQDLDKLLKPINEAITARKNATADSQIEG